MLKVAGYPAAPVCPEGTGAAVGRVRSDQSASLVGLFSPATTNKPVTVTRGGDACGVDFHLDYMSMVFTWDRARRGVDRGVVLRAIAEFVFCNADAGIFLPTGHAMLRCPEGFSGPFGVVAGYREKDDGSADLWVDLKGQAFEVVGAEQLRALYEWSIGQGVAWRTTRVDLAWDNPGFTVGQAVEAVEGGHVRTKAKRCRELKSRTIMGDGEGQDGNTCEIGSRESERFARIYDKRGPVRLELQLRERRAQLAMMAIWYDGTRSVEGGGCAVRSVGDQEEQARGLLRDFVDFVDVESDSNITRRGLLPWWAAFVDGVVKVHQELKRIPKAIERSRAWIERVVLPTLSTMMAIRQLAGQSLSDLASEWFDKGVARWTTWQRQQVNGFSLGGAG